MRLFDIRFMVDLLIIFRNKEVQPIGPKSGSVAGVQTLERKGREKRCLV